MLLLCVGPDFDDHVCSGLGCLLERCSSGAKQLVAGGEKSGEVSRMRLGFYGELSHSSFSHNPTEERDRHSMAKGLLHGQSGPVLRT